VEPDPRRRKALFDRVQEIVWHQAPLLYLVNRNALVAVSPALRNVEPAVLDPRLGWDIDQIQVNPSKLARPCCPSAYGWIIPASRTPLMVLNSKSSPVRSSASPAPAAPARAPLDYPSCVWFICAAERRAEKFASMAATCSVRPSANSGGYADP